MIGNSVLEYIVIRSSVIALRLVAPLSILYLATAAYTLTCPISPWIAVLPGAEALFYLLVYLPRNRRLQAPPIYRPSPLEKAQRQALFAKCCIDIELLSGTSDYISYPRGWFLPAAKPLQRQDVVDWLLCVIFSVDQKDAKTEEWKEEIDGYVAAIEDILKEKLVDGASDGARGMRPTVDQVKTVHRPLIWYSIVWAVDTLAILGLSTLGFMHYSSRKRFQAFPPRPLLSFLSHPGPLSSDTLLPYWYRPHNSSDKLPILFFHGAGIGLYTYIPLIKSIIAQDPDIGILLIEILPISMHMTADPHPPRPVLIKSLNTILESLNISRVVLAANSYGTTIAAQILHPSPPPLATQFDQFTPDVRRAHLSLQRKLAHTLLIDPIPILMHLPSVAYNFLYRQPHRAAEWQLWYFACTDADVARTMGRAFFWQECALWDDDLREFMKGCVQEGSNDLHTHYHDGDIIGSKGNDVPSDGGPIPNGVGGKSSPKPRDLAVVLAGKDQIIPAETIRRYLTGDSHPSTFWRKDGWAWAFDDVESGAAASSAGARGHGERKGGNLDVLLYPELDHAMVFDTPEGRQGMLDILRRFVRDN